jgi:phosphoglycerate dehydrogenase-like enzyme
MSVDVAIVGDYEGVVGASAPVARLRARPDVRAVDVFTAPIAPEDVATVLAPYPVIVAIRERTSFPAAVLAALPELELISQAGSHAAHIDLTAASAQGLLVPCGPADPSAGPNASLMPELVLGMVLSLTRELVPLQHAMAAGGWPTSVGRSLQGRTLGILGLGRHGRAVATVAQLLGMHVVAWGPTLTAERAAASGVEHIAELDELLPRCDVLSIHLKLSDLSRGLLDDRRLGLLPPHAILVNTARGAIVDEVALVARLADGRLGGVGLDVFTTEPLPAEHPVRALTNVVLTPHVGFTVDRNLEEFAADTVAHVEAYLDGRLSRAALLNPDAVAVDRPRAGRVGA